mmetsp:Transcript_10554/g.43071  ORF Transcript_10554/g.43071 Transcript_10554/m.43071 type:complete len:250 (-) Transcript_10554:269-1018(-)
MAGEAWQPHGGHRLLTGDLLAAPSRLASLCNSDPPEDVLLEDLELVVVDEAVHVEQLLVGHCVLVERLAPLVARRPLRRRACVCVEIRAHVHAREVDLHQHQARLQLRSVEAVVVLALQVRRSSVRAVGARLDADGLDMEVGEVLAVVCHELAAEGVLVLLDAVLEGVHGEGLAAGVEKLAPGQQQCQLTRANPSLVAASERPGEEVAVEGGPGDDASLLEELAAVCLIQGRAADLQFRLRTVVAVDRL